MKNAERCLLIMAGMGIGTGIALLFAPKSGKRHPESTCHGWPKTAVTRRSKPAKSSWDAGRRPSSRARLWWTGRWNILTTAAEPFLS